MVASRFTNPVHGDYFADPFVWRHRDCYYAIGTGPNEAAGTAVADSSPTIFPLLVSRDLACWRRAGHALVRPDTALGNTFWAPEVASAEGAWYLYYSVGREDRDHHLRVAKSPHPLGPYHDVEQLTDLGDTPFAIDPHPFRDEDGNWYLFHARDFVDSAESEGSTVRAGTALAVQPLATMTQLARGQAVTVARARHDWQRFAAQRPMYGRIYDWHTLEGPFVVKRRGHYYCLYSGGCWQTERYGVDYVVADNVMGPYGDTGTDSGPRVLRTMPGRVAGPGHCSVVTTAAGDDYLAYHAWCPHYQARRLHIDPIAFTDGGPRVPAPGRIDPSLAEPDPR